MPLTPSLLLLLPLPVLLAPQYPSYSPYSSYPTYYLQSYSSPQTFNYPMYSRQPYTQSAYSYQPTYPLPYRSQQTYSYPAYQSRAGTSQRQTAYQDPVFNYMLNDLSYFGPEVSRSPHTSAPPASPSPASPQSPAWQGKIEGKGATRCHDGKVLPFRARCNKVLECSQGEDEYDCDWHKRSTVSTVTSLQHFQKLLEENENVLVEFFAPWCPACVTFLPHLEKIKASTEDIPLSVVKVNTDDDPELKKLYSVDTFPRVMLWSKRWGESPTYTQTQARTYDKNWGMTYRNVDTWLRSQL